jgi:AraC-like DNA-binding protein
MSRQFSYDLALSSQERLPFFLSLRSQPVINLNNSELDVMVKYFNIMKETVLDTGNPYRRQMAEYLTKAFMYGAGYYFQKYLEIVKTTKQETLVEKYLQLVQIHYKQQRELNFYADLLCLTPKHLSKVVRETSGTPANDWIDNYVTLEAKALLKSTNMTIQQISDELNFANQSFFGKYFKRLTGMSPNSYRREE